MYSRICFARISAVVVAPALLAAAGCGGKDNFAKVNGQVITKEEYLAALERAPVAVPGAQAPGSINAGQFVLRQLVGKKVVMAEAAKRGVLPSDADVDRYMALQKRLYQERMPDKSFEDALKDQGATAEDIKEELRAQMAQTNLMAKEMKVGEDELKKSFETMKEQLGFPERVQLRLVFAPAGSKEFDRARKMISEKVDLAEVARQVNPPALRNNGGLMDQPLPVSGPQVPPEWGPFLSKLKNTAVGSMIGPVDTPFLPGQKAWVKVEKKLPAVTLKYEEAKPLLLQQQVQVKAMSDPQSQKIQQNILRMTMDANVQAADPKYQTMWEAFKKSAKNAGLDADAASAPTPVTAPIAGGS